MSFLKMTVLGRVGRDPEGRFTQSGKKVVGFSVAVDVYDSTAQNKKKTQWINVQSWNEKQQNVIESYVSKGTQVLLEGVPSVRSWVDNQQRTQVSLELDIGFGSLTLCGSKADREDRVPDNAGSSGRSSRQSDDDDARSNAARPDREQSRRPAPQQRTSNLIDDDIPF